MREREIKTHDGGRLALYTYGMEHAPGDRRVLIVGGAFLTALIYRPFSRALARALGNGWAVDIYDRRGRGKSTEQPHNYSMATEIADVRTVMDATGARHLLGHSLGGSVALNAAQAFVGTRHEPQKLAVYDAAVNIDGSMDTDWLAGFADAVNKGDLNRAMVRMKRGMNPGTALARVPEPVLAGLMAVVSRTKVNKVFRELLPSGVGELQAAFEASDTDFSVLPSGTHFMVGKKSPEYYKVTAARLNRVVPGSTLEVSPKGFHGSVPAAVKELVSDISEYFRS